MAAPAAALPIETWPDIPDRDGYEYVDGRWVKVPMGTESVVVSFQVAKRLETFVQRTKAGTVFPNEASFQIWPTHPKRYRKPDGAFIARGRLPGDRVPVKHVNVVPDLVIEVVSPFDRGSDMDDKLREYQEAGVRLIWVIYPHSRRAHVHRLDGTALVLGEDEFLTGEDVLPGFKLRLRDVLQPE